VKFGAPSDDAKPKAAPKAEWHPTTNTKAAGAASYAMLSTDNKNTFLVFSEKEMKGNDMPKADDKIAVYAMEKSKSADLERGDDNTFTLVKIDSLENPKADKSLEREEEEFLGPLAFVAAHTFLATAAFGFAPFPFMGMYGTTTSLSASLEKLGADLEVMDVPTKGLEREFFPFAPFFMAPAFAAFAGAAPLMFAAPFAAAALAR